MFTKFLRMTEKVLILVLQFLEGSFISKSIENDMIYIFQNEQCISLTFLKIINHLSFDMLLFQMKS